MSSEIFLHMAHHYRPIAASVNGISVTFGNYPFHSPVDFLLQHLIWPRKRQTVRYLAHLSLSDVT